MRTSPGNPSDQSQRGRYHFSPGSASPIPGWVGSPAHAEGHSPQGLRVLLLPAALGYSLPPLLSWMHQWELAVPGLR